jgi:hypothetical protein
VGTIDYMAPEQIEGRQVDGQADIYALGCVLFECLAGAPPFSRETEVAVLWAHMRDEPPALSDVRTGLPPAADAALVQALAKNPADRQKSCGELVQALREAFREDPATNRPTRVMTTTRVESDGAPPPRRGGIARLATAAAAGLLIGAGIASAALLGTRDTSTRVETKTVAVATTATAKGPAKVVTFRTPSGTIGCVSGPSLRCDIRSGVRPRPPRPATCDLDWAVGFTVGATGRATIVCAGDTAIDQGARVLRYGNRWSRGRFACLSRSVGLRCTNRSGHGFFLSRGRSYRF